MIFVLVVSVILMLIVLALTVWAISKGYKHEAQRKGDFDLEQFKKPLPNEEEENEEKS